MTSEDKRVARLALQAAALLALNELPDSLDGCWDYVATRGDLMVQVRAWRGADVPPDANPGAHADAVNTPCKRDVLLVLAALGASPERRFITDAVTVEATRRGLTWSLRSIAGALSSLRTDGLLLNDHDHRGYGLSPAGAAAAARHAAG